MLYTISGAKRQKRPEVFRELFEARHKVFIEQYKWSLPHLNGAETDQYDTLSAQYFFERGSSGSIRSHLRITEAVQGSLMADYFPHLVSDHFDAREPDTWEGTRLIISPEPGTGSNDRKRLEATLISEMLEWCLSNDVRYIQAVLETALLPRFLEFAPQTFTMGMPANYAGGRGVPGGGEVIAIRCPINNQAIRDARTYGNLPHKPCATCAKLSPLAA